VAAEGLEAGDEALGFAVGVGAAVEVVGAEVVIRCAGGQDVPDDDQDGVGDGDDLGLVLVLPDPSRSDALRSLPIIFR
jgi:hypothetical protein